MDTNKKDKVKLWTRQDKRILEDLKSTGVYRVKKEFILEKMDTMSDYYLGLYDWYSRQASRIVERPPGVYYPIWLSTSDDYMLQPTQDTLILSLEVDKSQVVFFDVNKWGYVVNHFYLPRDEEDEKNHALELERYGITNEAALISGDLGNFYPLLKNKIIKSWDRLFDEPSKNSLMQATLWEIKESWILDIRES